MRYAYPILFVFFATLTGCALLDQAYGIDAEGNPINPNSPSPAEAIGAGIGTFVPWAGSLISLLGWVYTNIRRKQYLGIAAAGIEAVSAAKGMVDDKGKIDLNELLRLLARKQDASKVREKARSMIREVEDRS